MAGFKQSKYRNKRAEYNGRSYQSMAEATRAWQLDLMTRAGEIAGWVGQVTFRLGCPENTYRCDFMVFGKDGRAWCEDTKGFRTAAFNRNVRLWKRYGPCELRIIEKGGRVEVIKPDCLNRD